MKNRFDHDRWAELAAAHALAALEPAEESAFLAHVDTCAACQRTVAETAEVAADLALSLEPVEPPAHVREDLLATIAATAQAPRPAPIARLGELPRQRRVAPVSWRALPRPVMAFAAAAALVVVVAAGAVGLARPSPARSGLTAAQAFVGCLQDTSCRQVALRDGHGAVVGAVLVHPRGVEVVARALRPNPSDSTTYVLWAKRDSGIVAAVGVFDVPRDPMAVRRLPALPFATGEVQALMVTLEAGRTAPASGSAPVASGTLSA